ncbi:MAG TPA: hypothetical protein VJ483_00805 [Holophagaceae bacterium]|nr:hypothetical protein [Holophagaceae bacterium]
MRWNAARPALILASLLAAQGLSPVQGQEAAAPAPPATPAPAAQLPAAPADIPFDRAWLGAEGALEFRTAPGLDLFYVAPGASLGRTDRIGGWSAARLPEGRSAADAYLAESCNATFPPILKDAIKKAAWRSGDIRWGGRVVDVDAAKRTVVLDLKAVDAVKGTLLCVVRRRLAAKDGAAFKEDAFEPGLRDLAKLLKKDLAAQYQGAKAAPARIEGALSTSPWLEAGPVSGTMADRLLDPSWFVQGQALEFHHSDEIDYLWVKPGFELKGQTLRIAHWESVPLPPNRDENDEDKAHEITAELPGYLKEVFAKELEGVVKCADTEGDLVVVGRLADLRDKHMYVMPGQYFDFKIADAKSGELLVAIHHSCEWGYPSLAMKKWLRKFASLAKSGLGAAYAKGVKIEK